MTIKNIAFFSALLTINSGIATPPLATQELTKEILQYMVEQSFPYGRTPDEEDTLVYSALLGIRECTNKNKEDDPVKSLLECYNSYESAKLNKQRENEDHDYTNPKIQRKVSGRIHNVLLDLIDYRT